jgi:hypothetical protein
MSRYIFMSNSTHSKETEDGVVEVMFYNKKLHVHRDGCIECINKHGVRVCHGRSGSEYDRLCISGHNVYRHQLVAYAFGLLDNIMDGYDVCHKISKASGGSDAIDNLFIDTHSFNIKSAWLEKRLPAGCVYEITRDTYDKLLEQLI